MGRERAKNTEGSDGETNSQITKEKKKTGGKGLKITRTELHHAGKEAAFEKEKRQVPTLA